MTAPDTATLLDSTNLGTIAGRRVLVTGASGFLGTHLCKRLATAGAEVQAVSRGAHVADSTNVRWWQADTADLDSAKKLLNETQPHTVFHLAGLVTARPEIDLVLPSVHSLFLSTVNLLTVAAGLNGCRVILIASLNEPPPSAEEPVPSSPYSAAKFAASTYGRMFHRLYGTPVVAVRLFMTYGPHQDAQKLVPHVALSLLRGGSPKLSSGLWQADWIYIDDAIEGMISTALAPDIEGSTIDIGSGRLIAVRDLVESIAELVGGIGKPVFGALPDRPVEPPARVADIESTYRKLGWRPRTELREGLAATIEWFRRTLGGTREAPSTLLRP